LQPPSEREAHLGHVQAVLASRTFQALPADIQRKVSEVLLPEPLLARQVTQMCLAGEAAPTGRWAETLARLVHLAGPEHGALGLIGPMLELATHPALVALSSDGRRKTLEGALRDLKEASPPPSADVLVRQSLDARFLTMGATEWCLVEEGRRLRRGGGEALGGWSDLSIAVLHTNLEVPPRLRSFFEVLRRELSPEGGAGAVSALSSANLTEKLQAALAPFEAGEAQLLEALLPVVDEQGGAHLARLVRTPDALTPEAKAWLEGKVPAQTAHPVATRPQVSDVSQPPAHPAQWEALLSQCPHAKQVRPGLGGEERPLVERMKTLHPLPTLMARYAHGLHLPVDAHGVEKVYLAPPPEEAERIRAVQALVFTPIVEAFFEAVEHLDESPYLPHPDDFQWVEARERDFEGLVRGLADASVAVEGHRHQLAAMPMVRPIGSELILPEETNIPANPDQVDWAVAIAQVTAALQELALSNAAEYGELSRHFAPVIDRSVFQKDVGKAMAEGIGTYGWILGALTCFPVEGPDGKPVPLPKLVADLHASGLFSFFAKQPNGVIGPMMLRQLVVKPALEYRGDPPKLKLSEAWQSLFRDTKALREEAPRPLGFPHTKRGCPIALRNVPVPRDGGTYELRAEGPLEELGELFLDQVLSAYDARNVD
jgi:hypothetical protein